MPTAILGLDAKVYFLDLAEDRQSWGILNVDNGTIEGEGQAADMTEVGNIKDVKYSIDKGTADVSVRGNSGWAAKQGTLKDAAVDITMVYDPAAAGAGELAGSFLNNTPIALAILSGGIAVIGTRGLWADFEVTKQDKDEPLTEGQIVTFTLTPSGQSAVAPEWVEVLV